VSKRWAFNNNEQQQLGLLMSTPDADHWGAKTILVANEKLL